VIKRAGRWVVLGGFSLALPLHDCPVVRATTRRTWSKTRAIEIRGLPVHRALRSRIVARLTATLARLGWEPVAARATFFDENGPKGGLALRCALTVRRPHRPHVRVEDTAETARTAFDGAFAKLERNLARNQDRDREAKRHPKKYYAARRMIAGERSGPGVEARTRGLGRGRA
jgi:ribosome-associated translation inhibitor RaiA